MNPTFPLASRVLGMDPFLSDPFFSGSGFSDPFMGTTMRRPLLGGSRAFRGAGGFGGRIACDMYEKEGKYEFRFDVAGCEQEDIDMAVDNNELMVKIERGKGCPDDCDAVCMQECPCGSSQRSVKLPLDADPDAIVSCYCNGILKVTVPKMMGKSTKRKLTITSDKSSSSSDSK